MDKERRAVRREEVRSREEDERSKGKTREKGRMEKLTAPTAKIPMCFQGWRICQMGMGTLSGTQARAVTLRAEEEREDWLESKAVSLETRSCLKADRLLF